MAGGVMINGPELNKTAEKTRENAETFKEKYTAIMNEVKDKIVGDFTQDGKAWTGVKAQQFVDNVQATEADFIAAYNNIKKAADTLDSHVQVWTNFDA